MKSDVLATYVTQVTETGSASRTIGFDSQLIVDLILQGVNTIILIVLLVLMITLIVLAIKALKIYIRKNS